MPSVARRPLDTTVFDYFRTRVLDPAALRQDYEASAASELESAAARLTAARMDYGTRAEELERLRGYLREGRLAPEEWRELRGAAEHDAAASAALARRRAQELEALQAAAATPALFEDWSAIRRAVAGEVSDGSGLEGVRAALLRVFDHFVVGPVQNPDIEPDGDGSLLFRAWGRDFELWAQARPEVTAAVAAYGAEPDPRPLRISGVIPSRKNRLSLATWHFGPVDVTGGRSLPGHGSSRISPPSVLGRGGPTPGQDRQR